MPAYKDGKTWKLLFYYSNYKGERIKKQKRGFASKRDAFQSKREFLRTRFRLR